MLVSYFVIIALINASFFVSYQKQFDISGASFCAVVIWCYYLKRWPFLLLLDIYQLPWSIIYLIMCSFNVFCSLTIFLLLWTSFMHSGSRMSSEELIKTDLCMEHLGTWWCDVTVFVCFIYNLENKYFVYISLHCAMLTLCCFFYLCYLFPVVGSQFGWLLSGEEGVIASFCSCIDFLFCCQPFFSYVFIHLHVLHLPIIALKIG